jgi:hypothetical protein
MKTSFRLYSMIILAVVVVLCYAIPLIAQPINRNFEFDKLTFTEKGELDIQPSATSSANDFDFLIGKWKLSDKKLKSRLTKSTDWISFESTVEMKKFLNGIGNMDIYRTTVDGKPFKGVALRLFNPRTRLWSIYWADSNVGVLDPPAMPTDKPRMLISEKILFFVNRRNAMTT